MFRGTLLCKFPVKTEHLPIWAGNRYQTPCFGRRIRNRKRAKADLFHPAASLELGSSPSFAAPCTKGWFRERTIPPPIGADPKKGTMSFRPTASSSALVKPVTCLPDTSGVPSNPTVFLKTIGAWQMAVTQRDRMARLLWHRCSACMKRANWAEECHAYFITISERRTNGPIAQLV